MDNAARQRRPDPIGCAAELELIGHHRPVDRLRGVRCVPTDHMRAQPTLRQDVPERLASTAGTCARANPITLWRWLGEAKDAVCIRAFPRGDRVPQDGREDWASGAKIARRSPLKHVGERGHQALHDERLDHLPVGSVPTDEQHTLWKPIISQPINHHDAKATALKHEAAQRLVSIARLQFPKCFGTEATPSRCCAPQSVLSLSTAEDAKARCASGKKSKRSWSGHCSRLNASA